MPCDYRILQSPTKGQVKLVLWETVQRSLLAVVIEEPQGGDTSVRVLGVVVEVLVKKKGGLCHTVTQPLFLTRVSRKRDYLLRTLVALESETT